MKRRGGFMLIECLVYIVILVVVLNLAYAAYYRCQTNSANLRRNAEDIAITMRAGERWRADIRAATVPPKLDGNKLVVPQAAGEVVYEFVDNTMWRQNSTARIAVLRRLRASTMQADARSQVTSWRWEVELIAGKKTPRLRPLFTFTAVAGGSQ
jgi:type II secretory pathway component PulJ